jgi:hypothetical protein
MTVAKLQPDRSMYLRGFDRRGAVATMHHASPGGFTVSGCWSDQADFAVLMLFDADDQFGHLFTSRYLPDFSLAGVTLDFDLAITGCMSPISPKFPSVPWNAISYIKSDETSGTVALPAPTITGGTFASRTYTVNGTPVAYDRVQLVYLGNIVWDYIVSPGDTAATVAAALVAQINGTNWAAINTAITLSAAQAGSSFTVTASSYFDGNSVELLELHKTGTCYLTPAGASKLTGGVDPSLHYHLDFSALGLASVRQLWLTLAPGLTYDAGSSNPALVAYAPVEFSAVFSSWTVADPGGVTPLKVAGAGSVTVNSRDAWAKYAGSGWVETSTGWYLEGFAHQSGHAGDTVTIKYVCQHSHDLYLGTALVNGGGQFTSKVDGVVAAAMSCAANTGSPVYARRLIQSGVAAGSHTVVLTIASGACTFDYLQAAVRADPAAPAATYAHCNCACDFDTDQTYKLAPARALWILSQAGFAGDIDFYAGVFFALKRMRVGGHFHSATVTLGGVFGTGSGFGDGDAVFVTVGGTTFGAAAFPADTLATLAQRLVDGINTLFVGVCAAPTATAGQFTVTTLSPINGFTLSVSATGGGTITKSGDIAAGNEGVWGVDASQTSPLNRGFSDYLADFAGLVHAAGQTMTVAFSQELLAPPDANTSSGAWTQRFADGSPVITATGFGSWGAGVVEANSSGTIQQTGHGYITGNLVHIASASSSGVWRITVTDADHYQLTTLISGGYAPAAGDAVLIELQTSQCTFNPATVTAYMAACYAQAAGILATAGLVPWLQFGEVGWWFFSRVAGLAVGYASYTAPISIGTATPHGLATGQRAICAGVRTDTAANNSPANHVWTVTKTDDTHVTLNGSSGNGTGAGGTISGGGMAYYDAWVAAAAAAALGRPLASFYTQDDDPTVNGSADAAWLASCIKTHIDAIRAAVLAVQAGAKFELLWPQDVNDPSVYWSNDLPYPQGGRLNRAVNLPAAYLTKAGSGLDRLKMEALSWGITYRNASNAAAAIAFPWTAGTWSRDDTAYLVPWVNGGCAWPAEFLAWLNSVAAALAHSPAPVVNFWAVDHLVLLGWQTQPLPANAGSALVF